MSSKKKPAPAASSSPPRPPRPAAAPAPSKVAVYYDGSRGPVKVTLRNPLTALKFEAAGIRLVSPGDAQDLLAPSIGGGAFARAMPLEEAMDLFGLSADLVASLEPGGELSVATYPDIGADSPVPYLVLDVPTRQRLKALAKEA